MGILFISQIRNLQYEATRNYRNNNVFGRARPDNGGGKCYTVDSKYIKEKEFCNLPVYPFENIEDYVDVADTEFVLGIGYSHMNMHRESKYLECKKRGLQIHTFISPQATVLTDNIGEGCIIMPGAYIGPYTDIGIGNVIRAKSTLSHHEKIGNFNWIADGSTFGGGVTMADNCFVGLGSTIRNEIIIAEKTFIGAHSYVSQNTLEESVMLGVPAKQREGIKCIDIVSKV